MKKLPKRAGEYGGFTLIELIWVISFLILVQEGYLMGGKAGGTPGEIIGVALAIGAQIIVHRTMRKIRDLLEKKSRKPDSGFVFLLELALWAGMIFAAMVAIFTIFATWRFIFRLFAP